MKALLKDIREIILQARQRAVRSVNHELTIAYWNIGRRLVEEEQQGSSRATYGKALIEDIATQLTSEFGNGFSANNLWHMRDFFLTFPSLDALSQELSWTHYRTPFRQMLSRAWRDVTCRTKGVYKCRCAQHLRELVYGGLWRIMTPIFIGDEGLWPQLHLPTEDQLKLEVRKELTRFSNRKQS